MTLKYLKPNTPSQRGTVLVDKSTLWKGKPMKIYFLIKIQQEEEIIKAKLHLDVWAEVLKENTE